MINYPPTINTDKKRLAAVYSLIEQRRIAHNNTYALAKTNWKKYGGKYQTFLKLSKPLRYELLDESAQLREKIIRAKYPANKDWDKATSDLRDEALEEFMLTLFGAKEVEKIKPTQAACAKLDELIAINLNELAVGEGLPDPTEDFTDYDTIADPGNDITVTADKLTFTDMLETADAYHLDDKGANHFSGDFEHHIRESMLSTSETGYLSMYPMAVTNMGGSYQDIIDASGDAQALFSEIKNQAVLRLGARELDGGTAYLSTLIALSVDTEYWVELKRVEAVGTYGTIYVTVWDDAYDGNEVGSESLALHTSKKDFRYCGFINQGSGTGNQIDAWCQFYDLQEEAPPVAEAYGYVI